MEIELYDLHKVNSRNVYLLKSNFSEDKQLVYIEGKGFKLVHANYCNKETLIKSSIYN